MLNLNLYWLSKPPVVLYTFDFSVPQRQHQCRMGGWPLRLNVRKLLVRNFPLCLRVSRVPYLIWITKFLHLFRALFIAYNLLVKNRKILELFHPIFQTGIFDPICLTISALHSLFGFTYNTVSL